MSESPESLFRQIAEGSGDALPPVHRWHPAEMRDIGMRISRDGTWWYQGSPIRRQRMVRAFSRVLRREGDDYYLVTPVEKVRVEVELAPMLAVRMEARQGREGPEIAFQTNTGDLVVADRDHPIRVRGSDEAPLPLVVVRDGIEALIARNVYYELVDQGELVDVDGGQRLVLRSRGEAFVLGSV